MSDIYYEIDGNIVKARFTKSWTGKFAAELLRLKIYMFPIPSKLKDFLLYMNYDECGTAKCHPDDVFNEYRGKQLARHRLIMKYLKDVDRISFDIGMHEVFIFQGA